MSDLQPPLQRPAGLEAPIGEAGAVPSPIEPLPGVLSDATGSDVSRPHLIAADAASQPPASAVVCAQCGAERHLTKAGYCVNDHPMCKLCGKGPNLKFAGRCAGGHPMVGNDLSVTHGLRRAKPVDHGDDELLDSAWERHQSLLTMQRELEYQFGALSRALRERPGGLRARVRYHQQLNETYRQTFEINEQLAASPVPRAPRTEQELARFMADRFCDQSALFMQFIEAMLAIEPHLVETLAAAIEQYAPVTSSEPSPPVEPAGPVLDDEPDEVIL